MRFAPSSRAGSAWEKESPKDFLNKVWRKSFSQAVHVGSLEVHDGDVLGDSLLRDQIEDIKDVKIKIDLDFVYSNWHGTCDPPSFKNVSLGTTFKEFTGWL